jgi:LysR family transcriptional regulator, hydrogen peroxide-inducible genes activator
VSQPALSMQLRDLERELGVELVERRPGEVALTEAGAEVARRAEQILSATRDLEDAARHRGRLLTGRLRFGVIPSLAPYVLPRVLPRLQRQYPELRVQLRETQTKGLLQELAGGSLDVAMLALPVDEPDLETARLFDDPFLLAVPADDARPSDDKVDASAIDQDRLILLEEGHCLRDQALAYCSGTRGDAQLGATSLSTVMQMVANGYGITLLPRVAVDVEVRGRRVKLLEFAEPAPGRTVGLAWRRTSPRKTDFVALRQLISEMMSEAERKPRPSGRLQRSSLRKREPSTGFPLTRE